MLELYSRYEQQMTGQLSRESAHEAREDEEGDQVGAAVVSYHIRRKHNAIKAAFSARSLPALIGARVSILSKYCYQADLLEFILHDG
jgi:hypothetical protein